MSPIKQLLRCLQKSEVDISDLIQRGNYRHLLLSFIIQLNCSWLNSCRPTEEEKPFTEVYVYHKSERERKATHFGSVSYIRVDTDAYRSNDHTLKLFVQKMAAIAFYPLSFVHPTWLAVQQEAP